MNLKKKPDNEKLPRQAPPFFSPEKIGASLTEVDTSVLQTESQKVVSRWFHSPHDADLFIWIDEKKNLIKHQVAFCGQIVEWNILEGVRTGVVVEQEVEQEVDGPSMSSSETIRFDLRPQDSAVHMALQLVRRVETLEEKTRGEILIQLTHRSSFSTMKPDEIVRQYGSESADRIWTVFRNLFKKVF